ncbi:MAG: ABC transporter permease [Candidatus Izemoplasmataceae bacterium]|jgi:spermidine/putrescine transport system permease protein|uniref:ABC transporter permease n=1 Tax=Liberiplasma polymorphum TaxID=3374570 RepID=UPI003775C2DD
MRSLKRLTTPYLIWMILLIVIPSVFIILAVISTFHIFNPYQFRFTGQHLNFLTDEIFIVAFKNSMKYAGITTIICFFIGYPVAYYFARMKNENKTLYVALLIIPIWSNMIVRIIAWENIFKPVSILNIFNLSYDLIGTDFAIIIAMISMYLPFMIFPIYSVLVKMDESLIEASRDLGASSTQSFLKITFPLSLGGIVSGVIMTLLPSMTAFALPERLGGGRILLLGNLIEKEIFRGSFNVAATVSFVVMIFMLGLFTLIVRFDKEGETLL